MTSDTIIAPSTPMGESALAVIRLSGWDCAEFTRLVFNLCDDPPPRTVQLGHYRMLSGTILDYCVYILYPDKRSYTGEPMLELHTHGNPLIVQRLVMDAIERGCRMARPGEFTRRAFTNGKLDLTQAEAVADVIHAKNERALSIAQRQLSGALTHKISALTDELITLMAHVEAYIDFPEEDLPTEDPSGPIAKTQVLIKELHSLIQTRKYSELLGDGLKTVIVGVPNAGKSSLLNALLGHERALVSDEPGTTRDFITERITLGPYGLQIIDTAGLRDAQAGLEARGIEKSLQKMTQAEFFLWVVDAATALPELPAQAKELLTPQRTLLIINKIDLPYDAAYWEEIAQQFPSHRVSLITGEGLETLRPALQQALEKAAIVPSQEDTLIVNTRHAAALSAAAGHLEVALKAMQSGLAAELVSCELRCVLDDFSGIVGQIDHEQILDKLFSSFCIGK